MRGIVGVAVAIMRNIGLDIREEKRGENNPWGFE
jgi:hypothetical protein